MQISCNVRADIGFLSNFLPPVAQPKMALEGLFLDEEQCMDTTTDEPHPFSSGQAIRLSPTPSLRIRLALAWISSALVQCLSNCLQALLGACCSGLACLTGCDKGPVADSRD